MNRLFSVHLKTYFNNRGLYLFSFILTQADEFHHAVAGNYQKVLDFKQRININDSKLLVDMIRVCDEISVTITKDNIKTRKVLYFKDINNNSFDEEEPKTQRGYNLADSIEFKIAKGHFKRDGYSSKRLFISLSIELDDINLNNIEMINKNLEYNRIEMRKILKATGKGCVSEATKTVLEIYLEKMRENRTVLK